MKKKTINNIIAVNDGISAASNIVSLVNPVFATIPLITYAVNRVLGLVSENDIIRRIKKFEKKLAKNKIDVSEFKKRVLELNEHDRYVVSRNLNIILQECIPETVETYIEVLIELIMNQNSSIYEEICEIISQLNKSDIILLRMIIQYKENGTREFFEKSIETVKKVEQDIKKENSEIERYNNKTQGIKKLKYKKWYDRDIKCNTDTIFWKDFAKTFDLETPEMGLTLIYQTVNENNELSMEWAFNIRSFLKLANLGLIAVDYVTTVGTSSNLNVDRFHITLFGQKLLYYINKK